MSLLNRNQLSKEEEIALMNAFDPVREARTDRTREIEYTSTIRPAFIEPVLDEAGNEIGERFVEGDVPYKVFKTYYPLLMKAVTLANHDNIDRKMFDIKKDILIEAIINSNAPGWFNTDEYLNAETADFAAWAASLLSKDGFNRTSSISTIHTEQKGLIRNTIDNIKNNLKYGD